MACESGFFLIEQTIISNLTCRSSSTIRRVNLQRLFWLYPHRLLEDLRLILFNHTLIYGMGIVSYSNAGAFLEFAYIVLDCTPDTS